MGKKVVIEHAKKVPPQLPVKVTGIRPQKKPKQR